MSNTVGTIQTELGAVRVTTFAGGAERGKMIAVYILDDSEAFDLTLEEARILIALLEGAIK